MHCILISEECGTDMNPPKPRNVFAMFQIALQKIDAATEIW